MGITLMTFSGLFAPLQQLAARLARAPARSLQPALARIPKAPTAACAGGRARASWRQAARTPLPARRPVRVVRVVEACNVPASAGRMVISGRMADVCAELDRLAAIEARRAC